MKKLPSLSILCLAYNEAENVRWAIPKLVAVASGVAEDYEIVLITHAQSSDGTREIIDDLHRANPKVRRFDQPPGVRGYGPAFAYGLGKLTKEFAFHVDIDGQFDFNDLPRAVAIQQQTNADLIHFNRHHRKDPWERKVIGLGFKALVHFFYVCPVWDFDSAFNLFRTDLLRHINIQSTSGMAVPEFLIRYSQAGGKIVSGWTAHRRRRAGKAQWEVKSRGVILPDTGIVRANLSDLWRLRKSLRWRFSWS